MSALPSRARWTIVVLFVFLLALAPTAVLADAFEVLFVGQQTIDNQNCIAVTFSAPVDGKKDFNRFMALYAEKEGAVDGAWVLTPKANVAYFVNVEADTKYEVQVRRGLRAADGKVLKSDVRETLRTRKVQATIAFADKGYILPSELAAGLPVNTVNVTAADVDFFRVHEKYYVDFIGFVSQRDTIHYYDMDALQRYAELAYSARFDFKAPKNVRARVLLPIDHIEALETPGIYLAVLRRPGNYPYSMSATYFTISDIGVHLRVYARGMEIQAQHLASAKPYAGVEAAFYDQDGDLIEKARCDDDGRATVANIKDKARLMVAREGSHITILPLTTPALDLSAFDLGKQPYRDMELFVYGPRDLYRPDETVILDGLLRDHDGRLMGRTPPVSVTFKQPDGREVKSIVLQARDQARYHCEFSLPDGAPTGTWTAEFKLAGRQIQQYAFKVEDFMPERMKLTLDDGSREPARRSTTAALEMNVLGEYLYGAPAAGNRVDCRVSAFPLRKLLPSLPGFVFGDVDEKVRDEFELDDMNLDDQGRGVFTIEDRWSTAKSPVGVRLHASLYESGGRPVSRDKIYHLWPAKELVGVRALWQGKNPDADSLAAFEVVRVNEKGDRLAADNLAVTLIREYPDYYWEYSESSGWQRIVNHQHYPVARFELAVKAGEAATINFPVEWGPYRLEINDPKTGLTTSCRFSAGWDWWGRGSAEQGNRPDQVVLTLDKPAYRPGDVARVAVKAPEAGKALVTVESDRLLWRKLVDVAADGTTVEIPVDRQWDRHDIYITALVIRPGDRRKKITPKRALGICHLPLDRKDRGLDLAIDAPAKALPGRKLAVDLSVSGHIGNDPVRITLAAVDVGVLNITQFKTPDPLGYFFNRRRYATDCYDMYQRLIEGGQGDLARMRFGGDADLTLSRGGDKPVTDVRIVSLYQGDIRVDANGKARVELDLPDFNGRLRLMAVAYGDRTYGSTDAEVTVAAPVVAEIAMPRFLAMGDQSMLALDVQNMSGEKQTLSALLTIDGPFSIKESGARTVELADKQKTTLRYAVTAGFKTGAGTIRLALDGIRPEPGAAPMTMQRQWRLGTRPAYPAVTQQWRKNLEPDKALEIPADVLGDLLADTVQAGLILSDHPPIDVGDHIKALYAYPYGCLEQTTSGIYPQVFLSDAMLARLDIKTQPAAERRAKIAQGIDRLAGLQKANGGFGLWSGGSPEEFWLTAYVADFLLTARDQGYAVSDAVLSKAVSRLAVYLRKPRVIQVRYSDNPEHARFAVQAYSAFVLARLNKAPLGTLRTLFDNHQKEALSGLPLVHLGLALELQGDGKRADKAYAMAGNKSRGNKYLGDYGSDLRDAALCYYLLSVYAPKTSGIQGWLLTVDDALRDRRWLSTQERNALALAGMQLLKGSGRTWQATIELDGAQEPVSSEKTVRRMLDGSQLGKGLRIQAKGSRSVYAMVLLSGYSKQPPSPVNEGISIERAYYDLKGNKMDPKRLTSGDMILVRLDLSSDKRVSDGLVVDLLPAGLELENQNLSTSFKIDGIEVEGKTVLAWKENLRLAHEEFRDDRYVAAVDIDRWNPATLFYLARAVTPGTYHVPNSYAEDMYRPYIRAVGDTLESMTVEMPKGK